MNARRTGATASWLFLTPQLLVTALVLAIPVLGTIALSFTRASPASISWRGLDNYIALIGDTVFHRALLNSVLFVVVLVPVSLVVGLLLAVAISPLRSALQAVLKLVFYLPVVLGVVVISIVWKYLFDPVIGLLNYLLGLLGAEGITWTADPSTALPSLMLVVFTFQLGEAVIILLAGLHAIPEDILEAARLDGASSFRLLANIVVPLLKPAILFTVVVQTIAVFQVWIVPYLLTGGGPANATQTVGLQIYQTGFQQLNFGLAASQGVVLMVVASVVALLQVRFLGRRVD